MKNPTFTLRVRHLVGLAVLSSGLLLQSCSKKESMDVVPAPTGAVNATAAYTLPIRSVSGANGNVVSFTWSDVYNGTPTTAATARLELRGPVTVVDPHVILYSVMGGANSRNGLDFTLPAFLPPGQYDVVVTTDKPNTSLYHDIGAGNFTTAAGTLTVTSGTIVSHNGLRITNPSVAPAYKSGQAQSFAARAFQISWPEAVTTPAGQARATLLNTNSGVYYVVGPPTTQNQDNMENWYGLGDFYSYGVGNLFDYQDFAGQVNITLGAADVPAGEYQLYLDDSNGGSTPATAPADYYLGSTITLQ